MAALRGRAAQSLRPGLITKAILAGELPLITGKGAHSEFVKEAAITDIHSTYKYLTAQENLVRPKDKQLRGMTYKSFITLFKFAVLLRLVEKVREEPMLFPPARGTLLSIRKIDDVPQIVESKRSIYRLTQAGLEDEVAWSNLCKAWIEHWPVPQKAIEEVPEKYVPPTKAEVPITPPVEEAPPTKPGAMPRVPKFSETPSIAQFRKLLAYLKALRGSRATAKDIKTRMYDVSGVTSDWTIHIEDALESAKRKKDKPKIDKFTKWGRYVSRAAEGFLDDDIDMVIEALGRLV